MATQAQIVRLVRNHRNEIKRLEESFTNATREERRALAREAKRLAADLVRDARRRGIPVADLRQWLSSESAYRALVSMVGDSHNRFTAIAVDAIRNSVAEAASLAQSHANLTVAEAIGRQFGTINVEAVANLVAAFDDASPLQSLVGISREATDQIGESLIRGIASGRHSSTIAGEIARLTDVPYWRAELISRTETFRAYRESTLQSYRDNVAVDEWVWYAQLPGACIACTAMHGSVHDTDTPMSAHPNCRCVMIPKLSQSAIALTGAPDIDIQSGSDWLASQDEAAQRSLLGDKRYQEWSSGNASLSDFVKTRHTAEYGAAVTVAPLKTAV